MRLHMKIGSKMLGVFCFMLFCLACKTSYSVESFTVNAVPLAPDYSQESSWALLPNSSEKEVYSAFFNSSDSLKADVFYVYPTLLLDAKDTRWNAPIEDQVQREEIINSAVKYQASAFAASGQLYVPIYRQAHIKSYYFYDKGGKQAFEIAYLDVKNAFEYYLKNYNNGRPIIIASHSQGTNHATQLLKDFFDAKPLQKKLIAAYIPGMGIRPNEFQTIHPMIKPSQTGGFVSWNTRKKNSYPKKKDKYKGAVVTNPITWDEQKTTLLEQHKGFLYSNDKMYASALSIELTDGMVWSTNPKFPNRFFMSFMKNYHIGDINLFWQDINENAVLRTKTWLENN